MHRVGRCADIGALARRRKRRNFAVEEIAAHAHEEDYVSGTARAAGIIGGWPEQPISVSLW